MGVIFPGPYHSLWHSSSLSHPSHHDLGICTQGHDNEVTHRACKKIGGNFIQHDSNDIHHKIHIKLWASIIQIKQHNCSFSLSVHLWIFVFAAAVYSWIIDVLLPLPWPLDTFKGHKGAMSVLLPPITISGIPRVAPVPHNPPCSNIVVTPGWSRWSPRSPARRPGHQSATSSRKAVTGWDQRDPGLSVRSCQDVNIKWRNIVRRRLDVKRTWGKKFVLEGAEVIKNWSIQHIFMTHRVV